MPTAPKSRLNFTRQRAADRHQRTDYQVSDMRQNDPRPAGHAFQDKVPIPRCGYPPVELRSQQDFSASNIAPQGEVGRGAVFEWR